MHTPVYRWLSNMVNHQEKMRKIGVGIIGLRFGLSHLQAYMENPQVEVMGICDLDDKRLGEVKAKYGVKVAVTDYRDLLKQKDIDAVSVVTPDHFHVEHSVAAMRAGKHVLCEKPMAPTVEECEQIIRTSDETDMKFMVGQVCRFTPNFILTKELISKGTIGELFFVESEYAHNYRRALGVGGWRKDPKIGREPFLGGACHAVDLVRWMADEVEEAFAYRNHRALPDWPRDDCTIAIFKFRNGVIGKVFCSIGCYRPYTMRSVFYGTKGTIISDNTSPHIWLFLGEMEDMLLDFIIIPVKLTGKNIKGEVDTFVDCVINEKPVELDGREGARTVATCIAAIESARKGKPVQVKTIK